MTLDSKFFLETLNLFQVSEVSILMTHQTEHTYAKHTILKKAEELFLRFGVKSVSMDDLARDLGISKKTLYQLFESKEDLILQTIEQHQCEQEEAVNSLCRQDGDALEEIFNIVRRVLLHMRQVSPATIFDMKKYYPEAWSRIEQMQREHIYRVLRQNLENGIRQSLYREDIDPEIIARLYLGNIASLMNESLFPLEEFSRDRLYREFILYHLRGIVSAKGLERLTGFPGDKMDTPPNNSITY